MYTHMSNVFLFSWESTVKHLSENHRNNISRVFRATGNYVEIVDEIWFWLENNDHCALEKKKHIYIGNI